MDEPKAQVGSKIYVVVNETEVTYSQATSTCTNLGGRLASSRWYSSVDESQPVDDPTKRCARNRHTYTYWEVASCEEPAHFACEFEMEPEDGPDSPCFPTVVLDTGSRPYEKPFQLLRAGDFSTHGRIIHLDCSGEYNITYKWRLRKAVEEDPTVLTDYSHRLDSYDVILNDVSVAIPRNKLDTGKYLLVLFVAVTYGENNDVTTGTASTWLEIEGSTPRLLIIGGSRRSQSGGSLMDSYFDGNVHDDSGLVVLSFVRNCLGDSTGQWTWTCRLPNGSVCGQSFEVEKEYKQGIYRYWYYGHILENKSRQKATSGTFLIRVEFENYIPYEQEVTLIPRGLPTCKIRCCGHPGVVSSSCSKDDNCNYLATKFDQRLRLWTECQKNVPDSDIYGDWVPLNRLGPSHSFYWSLKQSPDGFSGGGLDNNTLTGLEQSELIVKSNVFTVPGEYIIRLDILTNGTLCTSGNCSYAEWKFNIPIPPANARQSVCTADIPVPLTSVECNGNQSYSTVNASWAGEGCECREVSNLCTVGPTEGIALTTRFDLSCLDFEGQGAIRYEFYYRTRATASVSTLTTSGSGHNNLFYYGMSPSPPPFKLPSGLASDDYKVFIFVQMFDQEGTRKTSELEMTVRLPTFEDLLTAIDVTNAEVETAIRWGNRMEAVHLSTITAATLNNIRAEGAYGEGDWRETSAADQLYNMATFVTQKVVINRTDYLMWLSDVNYTVHFTSFEEGTWFRLPPLPVILRAYARSVLNLTGDIGKDQLRTSRRHFCELGSFGTQVFHSRWRNPFEYATNISRRSLDIGIGGLHLSDSLKKKTISGLEEPIEFSILRHNQSVYTPFKYNGSLDPADTFIFLAPKDPLMSPTFTLYLAYGIKPNATLNLFDLSTTLPTPDHNSYSLDLSSEEENMTRTVTSDPYSWGVRLGDVEILNDRNDTNWYLAAIFDDTKHPKPRYYLRVFTGPRANAGTTAKVSIMLHGATRECGPFLLHQPYSTMFEKGNMAGFVLCTETDPGWLTHVRVWHDNSGKEPSWFLDRIIVDDLLLEEQNHFLCNRWLAFDEDDEQIERVLPAAKDEQLVAFSTLFADKTTKDLRDGHIWYSVYGRPASSPFTRTQRVSCCLSIIMCTMLANIMFFGRGDDFDPPEPVTIFGFDVQIPISWPQILIGLQSAAVVFPINAIIIWIFRNVKQRPVKKGFILVFVTTNTAAFFVMLYTFEFGREKTEAWLLIFLTSFLSDLLLLQPVKILAMAALFAVFFKRANKEDEVKRSDVKKYEKMVAGQKQSPPVPAPHDSPDLAEARRIAVWRRKLRNILKEVAVYALFLAVVMLAAYGQKNHLAFHMSNEVQRLVVHNEEMPFEEVSDADSYWTWLEDAAVPVLYPDATSAVPDLPVYRVGPIRLRQARVKLDPACLTTVSPGNQTSGCDRRYDYLSQDEGQYGEGWLPLPTVNVTAFNGTNGTAETAEQNGTSPWRYRSSEDLQELPYAGDHGVYFGGGYVADISNNASQTIDTLAALKSHGWIDRATRAVFTDVALYSPDSNLFSIVTLLVEFTAIGAGFPRWEVHTVRLYRFHGGWEVWMTLLYISALAVFTLVFAIREVRKAYNSGALYIMDFWNWVELIIILQALAGVATFFYSEAVLEDVASKMENNTAASFGKNSGLSGRFVNYRRAAVWDQVYTYVIATLLCSVTLKMTHLLRFNHRASLLIHTLKRSVGPLSGFSAMFFLYFFAFAILLHLTFGLRMLSYSSFARTFEAMVTIIAGDINYDEISSTTGNLGTFILFLFVFVFNICLIGFFVAIIDESYHSAKNDEQLEKTDYDLKGFFKYQLQKLKPKKKARKNENMSSISGPGYDELKENTRAVKEHNGGFVASFVGSVDSLHPVHNSVCVGELRYNAIVMNDASFTIPRNTLTGKYLLVLFVSVTYGENNDVTTATVSTWIEIEQSKPRLLIIGGSKRCDITDNCDYLATKFDQRLRLWTECHTITSTRDRRVYPRKLGPEYSYYWSLKQSPDGFSGDGLENNTLTGQEQSELIVKGNVFTVPGEYIIRLDILTNGTLCTSGNCSYAEWKFIIPVPPANARQPVCTEDLPVPLSSGPMEGIALTTRFDLSCLDFEGQGAIRYEFYYRTRATASVSTLTTSGSGHNNLFQYGMSGSPLPFKLPSGLASDDYKVFIFVKIIDQLGTSKTSELEMTVRLPAFEDLLTAIDVTNAEVETAIRWGNQMEAVHLSTITAATLNNIRAEGAYGEGDWRKTSAADQLYNMAQFVTQKVTESDISQDTVERLSGIIFTGAFNVFKSSEVVAGWKHTGTGPPEDANTTEATLHKTRNATTTAFLAIDLLTDQILKGKRLVEDVTMISSQDFQVVVNRTDCLTWFNDVNSTVHFTSFEDGTWFRLPPLPVVIRGYARKTLNLTGDIDEDQLRIITSKFCKANKLGTQVFNSRWRNPFEYATNFSHRDLDIGIGGLHFSDTYEMKAISGLEEPIEFSILRHNQSVVTAGFDDVEVDGTVVAMDGKRWKHAFFTHSYSLDLSTEENVTRTVTSDPYSWRVRLGDVETGDGNDTNWYLGIKPTSVDGMDDEGHPKQPGTVSFSVFIEPVECVFFNEEDHSWDRSGCEVGPLTTTTHLHCRCDHLTKFSGLTGLVAPNEINFERALKGFLLKNLIQNPIGIMTCCVLFSFYIALCVPWTRKNDAKDLGKITTAAIFDDTKHPKPRYYLRVFTGPRANAGTTAKVSIMLHGATRECGPFLLHQPYSAMFEKGNMAGFVLCTETDPGWLTHVRVWHDNSGKEPSWFLDRIIVDDLLLEEQHYFLCNRWLAFDEDDEQIERVLPAAKDEQLVAFSTLFTDRTTKDLRDGHIWYSVYGRPASSPFTRTQRVSCCLSIIMCTMLANIMFFGRGDDFDPPEPVTIFGFDVQIPISWPQILIGLQSAAVVFPINAIIIWIFRNVKQRPVKKGFILVFVTTNTAAFFVMLYTFEFGREKTEAWLLIFLTSFLSDLILLQPVKILAMAALFAVFFKKANKEDEVKRSDVKKYEEMVADQKQSPPVPAPHDSPDLAEARRIAVRRRKLRNILKEVAVYALFLAVVMLAAYGQKNHLAFHMSKEVQRLVVHNEEMSFEEVVDTESYWTWLEDAAVPVLYPDATSALPDPPVYRVGPIRLRQARVKLDPACLTTVSPGNQTSGCDRRYNYLSQDEGQYGEGWLPLPTVNITTFNGTNGTAETAEQNSTSPWRYRSSEDLQELPYAADHGVYFGGGYVADTSNNASQIIEDLKSQGWIDRAVFTDVTLYSPDSNLFSIVTLLVEFTAIGAGFPRWEVHTVRLYRFHGGWEVWMALLYISALAIFALVFAIKEGRKAYNSGALYIMDFWNWVELIIILQALAGVATFFYSEAVLEDVASKMENNTAASFGENSGLSGRFVNYKRAAVWDQVYTYVIATLLCSVTLKMTHLLRFNHRASLLIHTLKRSVGPLSGFSAMFFLYFFAFAILLHLTFGLRMLSYSSFARTFEAMVTIIAGDINYDEISTTTGNLGTFILFLFVFVFNICLIGFFVAIIDESYHSAKDDEQLEKTDYDLKGFFKYQLQKLKPKKKARQDDSDNTSISGPGYDELKVNVMKRLRTVFEDLDER
uniref:PLAT domain-containing protein n=1 Tax=Branchiostoma floridae TaxID=7739 RepID=C3YTF7_BRAFL|eukprot:XP_002600512.1 hypothetical protein BRAFLDRAFT_70117 [Branchiostoma floridae]